jgi:hypothetical protein
MPLNVTFRRLRASQSGVLKVAVMFRSCLCPYEDLPVALLALHVCEHLKRSAFFLFCARNAPFHK